MKINYFCGVFFNFKGKTKNYHVGRRSIVDKASAYGKGPGFTTQWRQQFINLIMYALPAVVAERSNVQRNNSELLNGMH